MSLIHPDSRLEVLVAHVEKRARETEVFDPHTHLYDPAFGGLMLWGIDELLTYHYLIAEYFRRDSAPYERFWDLGRKEQADLIWSRLFVESSPVSEACRGVVTTLASFGLEPRHNNLGAIRGWFEQRTLAGHLDDCFKLSGTRRLCMTNSPFDDHERPVWKRGFERDPRFAAALRIDPLLLSWREAGPRLRDWGYDVDAEWNERTIAETRRFLEDWTERIDPWYLMVSLPPEFDFPAEGPMAAALDRVVLPHCLDHGLPFAMMPGVRRGVNPALRLAGDGVGAIKVSAIARLCETCPDNKFLVTALPRENQHELCVTARKFRNLHLFGCWWFLNVPSLVEEITEMRIELLGTGFTAQHSDARVLDQVVYKWRHSREIIAGVLSRKYRELWKAGWHTTFEEVDRDVAALLGGAFEAFCGRE
jgi:hypothetical protein